MSRNNLFIIIGVLLVLLVGFYFVNSAKKSTAPSASPEIAKPTETSTSSATMEESIVTVTSSGFSPKEITVKAGGSVTWVNNDTISHQINSAVHPTHQVYPPLNDVGLLKPGERKSLTFPTTGTYKYHDHLNPSLTGTVVVQ